MQELTKTEVSFPLPPRNAADFDTTNVEACRLPDNVRHTYFEVAFLDLPDLAGVHAHLLVIELDLGNEHRPQDGPLGEDAATIAEGELVLEANRAAPAHRNLLTAVTSDDLGDIRPDLVGGTLQCEPGSKSEKGRQIVDCADARIHVVLAGPQDLDRPLLREAGGAEFTVSTEAGVELEGAEPNIKRGIAFLEKKGVKVEPVVGDVVI